MLFSCAALALACFQAAEPQIARDLRYAEAEGVAAKFHSLDLYAPPKSEQAHPVLIMVHGGGWTIGDKRNAGVWKSKAPTFVEEGWIFVSINYRLTERGGAHAHPAHVEDVAAAIAWVHDHVQEYGGDPDRLFLMGHSAGAHLAALVATDARRLAKHKKPLSVLKGVICLDTAGYDIAKYLGDGLASRSARAIYTLAFGKQESGWKDASPQHHLAKEKHIPPMLVFHTKERRKVAHLSQRFVAGLRAIKVPAVAIYAANQDHAGINRCIGRDGDPYTALIQRFLADPQSAEGLEMKSREPVRRIRPQGSVRLEIVHDWDENTGPIAHAFDWEVVVQIDGKPYSFGMKEGGNPLWQLHWAVQQWAKDEGVKIQSTRGPKDAWLDLDGNVEWISWQCVSASSTEAKLEFRVLPRAEQQ